MHPSLYALFCRSKYAKGLIVTGEDDAKAEKRHLQVERYAVTAIAFCLKHDGAFLRHFLSTVCEASDIEGTFEILIEDKRWGDLVLVANDHSAVFVVECKIKADLDPHQNPVHESNEFWESGYGSEIIKRYGGRASHIEYIVLGYVPKLVGLPKRLGQLMCVQKSWHDLKEEFPTSPLCKDLASALAAFHVTAFRSGRTDTMKMINEARMAAEIFGLLKDVLDETGLPDAPTLTEIDFDDSESWQYGLALKAKRGAVGKFKELQDLVLPTGSQVGWFGYTNGTKPDETRASVWFYGQPSQFKLLKKRLIKAGIPSGQISTGGDENMDYLVVETTADEIEKHESDKAWFKKVFVAVLG